ncbi:MAG: hypothetical protein PHC66_03825 [Candidatus Nanoarchaeia archaeon]|nr:hypothetical protein [Candidatus Nanoarchaeia archaeon]MDD5239224.1 hypothetical protein [Candidatus Nanoarchaeia archaeon]
MLKTKETKGKPSIFKLNRDNRTDKPVQKQLTPDQIETRQAFGKVDKKFDDVYERTIAIDQKVDRHNEEYKQDKTKYDAKLAKISDDVTQLFNALTTDRQNMAKLNNNTEKLKTAYNGIAQKNIELEKVVTETANQAKQPDYLTNNEKSYLNQMLEKKCEKDSLNNLVYVIQVLETKAYDAIESVDAINIYDVVGKSNDKIDLLQKKDASALETSNQVLKNIVFGIKCNDLELAASDEELENAKLVVIFTDEDGKNSIRASPRLSGIYFRGEGDNQEVLAYVPEILTPKRHGINKIATALIYGVRNIDDEQDETQEESTEGD